MLFSTLTDSGGKLKVYGPPQLELKLLGEREPDSHAQTEGINQRLSGLVVQSVDRLTCI